MLEEVAKILKVPVDAIKNLDDSKAVNYFNTFNDSSVNHGANFNYQCTFNPFDKYIEQVEENKKLYRDLLKEKDEKIALLEKMLEKK